MFIILILVSLCLFPFVQNAQQTETLTPIKVDKEWGYANARGELAIPAQFDTALPFSGRLARVGMIIIDAHAESTAPNFMWGYIDNTGRVVVELRYNSLRDFSEGLAAAAVKAEKPITGFRRSEDLRWGSIDLSGRVVVPLKYFDVGDFSEGFAAVNEGESRSHCGVNDKFGYIDATGAVVIEPRFAVASGFHKGRARVGIGKTEYIGRCLCCAPRFVGQYGYVDPGGNFVPDEKRKK